MSKYKDSKISNELKELISLQDNLKNLRLSAINSDWTNIIPSCHNKYINQLKSIKAISIIYQIQRIKIDLNTIANWITSFSRGWKHAMALQAIEAAERTLKAGES
ncbi:hypothetical protein C1645_825263 [Glomus cerebriforme]|uniref:Uncharacterized protein n=1 Tax=Glomus cerebriforme TaxID=658196 RepID=A0A397ST08_9GLOM|nr:hypothetical protein C1645_825263 [Glomus cerebriforme]